MTYAPALALVTLLAMPAAAIPADGPALAPGADSGARRWGRTPFVIGAPGRLDSEGDRREPRRCAGAESLVGAYADIEIVRDSTWLGHEVEHYVRRAVDCAGVSLPWCGRTLRRFGMARVIALTAGAHAELVWLAGRDTAVRLGWQRVVQSPTGTMTLDDPPADFAAALLAEFPSRLQRFDTDPAHDAAWRAEEIDRLLYYADQVLAGLPAVRVDAHRDRATQFVEQELAEIERLRDSVDPDAAADVGAPTATALDGLWARVAAVRAWRAVPLWCGSEPISSAALLPSMPRP